MSTSAAVRDTALDRLAINTIRFLALDAVEKAKSGHPGMPMGMADVAYVIWMRYLRYQPRDPQWPDRDRFVLSAGHGSMLLYAMLHLTGYDLPLDELQRFRQLGSRTPGHPEHGLAPGIETTTGPLGQGFGNGVGMALAARMLAARVNTDDFSPVTHRVFGIVSDGDLMDGVASEAASLAGHWGLGNLLYVYDDNHITIEGDTALAFTEDVAKRFEGYGWQVGRADPYDHEALSAAIDRALADPGRPSLVITRSHIGYGAPNKQDTREAHGEALGAEEASAAKRALGWPDQPPFRVPDEVRPVFARRALELAPEVEAWRRNLARWKERHPNRAAIWDAHVERRVLASAPAGAAATRVHGNAVLQKAAALVPALAGGSADLEPSTRTRIAASPSVQKNAYEGRNLHFGVREHGMAAIANGMAVHGSFIPYGSSFLIFTDYARPSIRLSALMEQQVIWVFTHDSVFLGEDGPTHQPIEHLTALRAIPHLLVVRPADGPETAGAWGLALERRNGPTLLALTRQNLPALEHARPRTPDDMRRGGYLLRDASAPDPITFLATGSEVWLAVEAAKKLEAQGLGARVVSAPAPQLLVEQDAAWQGALLGPARRRVSLEAGATAYWYRFIGLEGLAIGIDRFGASAPYAPLQESFGLTPDRVTNRVKEWLGRS
ncbi:MAG: transketolase [Candidatus Eisenbacteria bacterium]|uniref:Transketolase n=1 Tax=Eiseniibacteriota bacterium TaxID=2212470 RepID=A0A538U178_UNCEI|nr:MAG: transketolase [Candidatus Eisenbacteria bacterium]